MKDNHVTQGSFRPWFSVCLLALVVWLPARAVGEEHSLLLVPITYSEVAPASGFDGLTQPNWLMVPQYGNNFAKATMPASAALQIGFFHRPDSTVDSVSPAATNTSPQVITVHGETLGDAHKITIGLGTKVAEGGELHVSVKPLKMVKVALHGIVLQKGDAYGSMPNMPTAAQAQDYLNQVYGPQTNTYFNVSRRDYSLAYDVGGRNAAVDGKLDFSPIRPFTDEQIVIEQSEAKDKDVDHNIYFVREYLDKSGGSVGHAVRSLNVAYIQDYSGKTTVLTTLAHEIGHLFGLVHAEIDIPSFNKAYLPGTDQTIRLMYGGILNSPNPNPKMLIKAEWDIISVARPSQEQ